MINSHLLYQLSYRGIEGRIVLIEPPLVNIDMLKFYFFCMKIQHTMRIDLSRLPVHSSRGNSLPVLHTINVYENLHTKWHVPQNGFD